MKNNVSSKILLSDEMEDMLNDAEMKNLPDELFLQLGVDESESGIKFRRRLQDFLADNYDEVREAVEDGTGMSALKSNPIRKAYEQYLMEKMESEVDFMLPLNSLVVKSGMYDEIIGEMLDEGKIELFDRVYRVKMPHVSDWISQISSQNQRTAVMLRAEGNTLEECGSKMGNRSRQSVDQLIRSALRNKPALREDDYRYWFERYNMDREAFNTIFLKAETDCTYGYLVMVCGRRRGKKDVSEMFNDPLLTKRMYHGLRLYMTRDSVFIHGEDVPLRTSFIAECIARNEFADREGTIREFYNRYVQILKEKHIQDDKRLNKSLRAFEGIVDRMSWCLQKTGRIVRYCPITADEVREFVSAMNLDQYRNIEMSTEKIFRDNAEMMKEYDIRDGYELHSFLRKNEKIWNGDNRYDIYFSRMPNIRFGKSDRNRQVRDLMFRLAPVSLDELSRAYEDEYGVSPSTFRANMTDCISGYYDSKSFSYIIDQPALDASELVFMNERLEDDFYFTDDVVEMYTAEFGEEHADRINSRSLKQLGFKMYSQYVIRDSYQSARDFFMHLLLADDVIDLRKLDARLGYQNEFNTVLQELRKDYSLLEYSDRKYMTFDYLKRLHPEVTKDDLRQYVGNALAHAEGLEYFTVRKLERAGFHSNLEGLNQSDWFFAGLIRNSGLVNYTKAMGGFIFRKGCRPTASKFLRHLTRDCEFDPDFGALSEKFSDEYGLLISEQKLFSQLKSIGFFGPGVRLENSDIIYRIVE